MEKPTSRKYVTQKMLIQYIYLSCMYMDEGNYRRLRRSGSVDEPGWGWGGGLMKVKKWVWASHKFDT